MGVLGNGTTILLNDRAQLIVTSIHFDVKWLSMVQKREEGIGGNESLHLIKGLFVEFWGLPPLILFFNMSIGWFGRFALSTECYRTRKLGCKNLNWPRCSARVTESLVLTDGGFCQKQTLNILDYVKIVSL